MIEVGDNSNNDNDDNAIKVLIYVEACDYWSNYKSIGVIYNAFRRQNPLYLFCKGILSKSCTVTGEFAAKTSCDADSEELISVEVCRADDLMDTILTLCQMVKLINDIICFHLSVRPHTKPSNHALTYALFANLPVSLSLSLFFCSEVFG
jgi:hypothetical protein